MVDFGERLRQAREQRGISLRQISANTKINVAALEALERNDVSKLPGGIFSRSFVRAYAAEVGLDPDQTVHEFIERFDFEAPPEAPVHLATEEDYDQETQRHAMGLAFRAIAALVLVAVGVAFFFFRDGEGSGSSSAAAAAATAPRAEVATTPPPTAPPATPAVDDVLRKTGPMRLEIHPTGPCWIKLTADGQDVFAKLMQAGQKEVLNVTEAVISIGDAGAFAFSVDGRPGKTLGGPGEVKTARITRETLAEYLR